MRSVWLCVLAGCAAAAIAAGAALSSGCATSALAQSASPPPSANVTAGQAVQSSQANIASAQDAAAAQEQKPPGNAPVDPQKQEVADECARLLKMAAALKTEVDKTNKDTLSVTVVREAGEIEQLAHKVRAGMGKD